MFKNLIGWFRVVVFSVKNGLTPDKMYKLAVSQKRHMDEEAHINKVLST